MSQKSGKTSLRRVAVVTGTRAEYGLLCSTITAIHAHPKLELQLAVTGMHLLKKFGYTISDIRKDGWHVDARVPMQIGDDSALDQATGLAKGVKGLSTFFTNAKTDVVVVLGDRIEAMAGALAGVTTGTAVAHIHGGDVAEGDLDESLRHAITKLAHIHFPATKLAEKRIIKMGEDPSRVYCVGAPGLDRLHEIIDERPTKKHKSGEALVVYHAYGRSAKHEAKVMATVLDVVRKAGLRRIILSPNSDRGHAGVFDAIQQHAERFEEDVEVIASLERDAYLRKLLDVDVLVGNSSSGIIEAPFAGTPTVNIGDRQAGREAGGRSVIQCEETRSSISTAAAKALRLRPRRGASTVYGDGKAGARIAKRLAIMPLTPESLRKRLAY